jgi:hypothetical protein
MWIGFVSDLDGRRHDGKSVRIPEDLAHFGEVHPHILTARFAKTRMHRANILGTLAAG